MERLNSIIKESLAIDPSNVNEDEKFISMEIWDSMTFMFFITRIEEVFEITLTNEEIINMDCIKATKDIISSKLN